MRDDDRPDGPPPGFVYWTWRDSVSGFLDNLGGFLAGAIVVALVVLIIWGLASGAGVDLDVIEHGHDWP